MTEPSSAGLLPDLARRLREKGFVPGTRSPALSLVWRSRLDEVIVDGSREAVRDTEPGDLEMNWNSMEGDWKQLRGNLKARWDKLTDDDLEGIAGNRARFVGRLREVYGLTEQRAEAELRDWERHHEPIEPGGHTGRRT